MPSDRPLIYLVERFLRESGMAATSFGRAAVRDPRYVLDLRLGRESRAAVRARVERFMAAWRADQAASADVREAA